MLWATAPGRRRRNPLRHFRSRVCRRCQKSSVWDPQGCPGVGASCSGDADVVHANGASLRGQIEDGMHQEMLTQLSDYLRFDGELRVTHRPLVPSVL